MPQFPEFKNRLLMQLPLAELAGVVPHLEPVHLPTGFCIVPAGGKIDHVYFLESGLGSVVTVSPNGHKAEAGMFGREAFAPTPAAVGLGSSLHEVIIQSAGTGHRIETTALQELFSSCPVLAGLLARSSHNLATQISYTALSNRIHKVDVRLARWLLMCHDRSGGDLITITHTYIALMLAVRRPTVTETLHILEGTGFIRAERKRVIMRNRSAMEDFASDAYGEPEREFLQLFGIPLLQIQPGTATGGCVTDGPRSVPSPIDQRSACEVPLLID